VVNHFEDLLCVRKRGWLYDSASAAKTHHFGELFDLRKDSLSGLSTVFASWERR
jgi:hypothetical protein